MTKPNLKIHSTFIYAVLAMFGIGQTDSQGKKVTLFRTIGALGGIGIFMTVVMLAILIGSIAAILS